MAKLMKQTGRSALYAFLSLAAGGLIFLAASLLVGAETGDAASEAGTGDTRPQVAPPKLVNEIVSQRGANRRVWQAFHDVQTVDPLTGQTIVEEQVSQIVEVGTGICYLDDDNQWQATEATWSDWGNGFMMNRAPYTLQIGATVGSWLTYTIGDETMYLKPDKLVAYSGGQTAIIATLDASIEGAIDAEDASKLMFRDAFGEGIDLEIHALPGGFHQNVIFRSKPAIPAAMDSGDTQIHLFTEVNLTGYSDAVRVSLAAEQSRPVQELSAVEAASGDVVFSKVAEEGGAVLEKELHRFVASDVFDNAKGNALKTTVAEKSLIQGTDGRRFLVETVNNGFFQKATYPVVWDPVTINGSFDPTDNIWYADTTYYVSANLNIDQGELRIEPGTFVKFAPGTKLYASGTGKIIARGKPHRNIVFTSKNDNSNGEVISGSTGSCAKGSWNGIQIGDASAFEFCTVLYSYGVEITGCLASPFQNNYLATNWSSLEILSTAIGSGETLSILNNLIVPDPCSNDPCDTAFRIAGNSGSVIVRNNTFANVGYVLIEPSCTHAVAITNNVFAKCNVAIYAPYPYVGSYLTSDYNGYYNNVTNFYVYGKSDGIHSITTTAYPFSSYYTLNTSQPGGADFTDAGDSSVESYYSDPNEWATFAVPASRIYSSNITFTTDTTWERKSDTCDTGVVDLGCHYPRVDYKILYANITVDGATLEVKPGTVIAHRVSNSTGAGEVLIQDGGEFVCVGDPFEGGYVNWVEYNRTYPCNYVGCPYAIGRYYVRCQAGSEYDIQFSKFFGLGLPIGIEGGSGTIRDNIFQLSVRGLDFVTCVTDQVVENCVMSQTKHGVRDYLGDPHTILIQNCTFDRNWRDVRSVGTLGSDIIIKNCLFHSPLYYALSDAGDCTWDESYNAFFDTDLYDSGLGHSDFNEGTLDSTDFAYVRYDEARLLVADPLLSGWTDFDDRFHLRADSQLINAGYDPLRLGMCGYTTRLDGTADGGVIDIGFHYPVNVDTDGDGLLDYQEFWYGFYPDDTDSNDDGISDYAEYTNATDLSQLDSDDDGLTNTEERLAGGYPQLSDNAFPYTSTSFEVSEGFDWYDSIGIHENWDVNTGTARIEQAAFHTGEYSYKTYQHVEVNASSTITRQTTSTEENSRYVGINCIPTTGSLIKIMSNTDIVAAVKFHDTVDKVQVYDSNSLTYLDPDPTVVYQDIAAECAQYLENPTLYWDDPNYSYSYENTWVQLEIRLDWDSHEYDAFWRHLDDPAGSYIMQSIPMDSGYEGFTSIVFENASASDAMEINRLTFSTESTSGGEVGENKDIWITKPEAETDEPLQGHCVIAGTIWYDGMSQYKIKCCPTYLDPDDYSSWMLLASGTEPKKQSILGFWDTWGFRNGDYYLKVELYNELGYLIESFDDIITKEISYDTSGDPVTKDVDVAFSIIGKAKGKTYHYEDRPDISINWAGSFPFDFKRVYDDNLRSNLYPLFFGWTHNHNIRIIEDTTRDWVTTTEGNPDKDGNGVGIGKVWLQEALGCRLFVYDSADTNKVTYKPVDNENDYIVRTSTIDGSDYELSYVHCATDGMKMIFDDMTLNPTYTPAAGQGVVDWAVSKGIERKEDRFGNALEYTWNDELQGRENQSECYIMEISNNRTRTKIVFEDDLMITSDPNAPQLYSKVKLVEPSKPEREIMSFSLEPWSDWWSYAARKLDDDGETIINKARDSILFYYDIGNEITLDWIRLPHINADGDTGLEDQTWLYYDSDGALARATDVFTNNNTWGFPFLYYVKDYDYLHDSGCLRTSVEYSVVEGSTETLLRKQEICVSPEGTLISDRNTTYRAYHGGYFDPYDYRDPSTYSGDLFGYLDSFCWQIGGGGASQFEYYYTDEQFPMKPTIVLEAYNKDSGQLANESVRWTTIQYDENGLEDERRMYIDWNWYTLTQYDYHDDYLLPVRETTWQGYCYDDALGDPVVSGAKVEKLWLYGDPNGTPRDGDDEISGKKGDFLVQEKQLLAASDWAVTAYEYYPVDDSGEFLEGGQIKTKETAIDSQDSSISYFEYDPNGLPSKEWHGVLAFDQTTGKPCDPQTSALIYPQKRHYFDAFGVKRLDADYLGKVNYYVIDDHGRVCEDRVYFDLDVMGVDDANFVPERYDDPSTQDDDDDYISRTTHSNHNYHNAAIWTVLPQGGLLYEHRFHDGKTLLNVWYDDDVAPFCGETSIAYANDGRPLAIRNSDATGTSEDYAYMLYDSMNRLVHKYEYNFIYDGWWATPYPFVKHTEFGYYGTGQKKFEKVYKVVRTEDGQGNPIYTPETEKFTCYYYDAQDRLIRQVEDRDGNCITTEYGYDAVGNRTYVIDPKGMVIFTDYDSAGRKVMEYFAEALVYDPDPNFAATYDNAAPRKAVEYYRNDKVKKVTSYDHNGSTVLACSEYVYDSRGRIAQVDQQINTTPTYATTCYDYYDEPVSSGIQGDPNYYHIRITDAEGKYTWIELTPLGKPAKVLYPSGDYEKIEYYGYGLPKKKYVWDADDEEHTILYEYDAFGKLSKVTYPDDPDTQDDESGTLKYEYTLRTLGEYGKVKTITDNRCDMDRPGALGSTYTFEYFDWSGNLASYTNPEGFTVNYDYNTAWNRKSQIEATDFEDVQFYKVDYTYDPAGRLTNVIDSNSLSSSYIAGFDYDANGNRTLLDYYLEGTTDGHTYGMDYTHTADNFLKTIVTTSTTTGAPSFVFDANDVGDIDGLGRLMQADVTIYPDTSTVSHAFDYTYDMMSQLTSAKATNIDGLAWLQEDFTYNKDGNVTDYDVTGSDSSSAATDYSYTNSGDSDIMAGATGDGAFTLSNDLNGNTTKLPTSSANDVVEYNWDNKLRFARKGDLSIWVKYDPMGNRVWRQSYDGQNTTTKKYVVDISGNLPTIIAEYSDPNSLENQYFYADAQILCQYVGHDDPEVDDQTYYYVHDRLGSVRLVVDCNMVTETVTARNIYTYSPFGNPYAGTVTEAVYNPFQFLGQWFDAEINQYYLRARQYDPIMMRFMARDPVSGKLQEPLTLHKYLYCLNNAINLVDLTGAYSDGPWWAQYEFWSEIGNEIVKGAAATLDGLNPIPFCNFFESVYANPDGSVDQVYVASRLVGSASRTALSIALNAYAVKAIVGASGISANVGSRIVIGMLWKGVVVENALGKGAALTVAGIGALVDVMGVGDNIFDVLDVVGYR